MINRTVLMVAMLGLCAVAIAAAKNSGNGPKLDTSRIEELTGVKGTLNEKERVFRVTVPRNDLSITTAGVKMTPPMGLTSWAAFKRDGNRTMVMGDMVLTEDQVNPAMSTALDNGLEVTALHNHFFWDSPKVMFMHIGGMGDETKLASAVGKLFANMKQTSGGKGEKPDAQIDPAHSSLDPAKLDSALGLKGQYKDGVYKF